MKKGLMKEVLMLVAIMFALSFCGCNSNSPEKAMTKEGDRVIENAVKDIDGNTYDAVKIGNQVWMKSNLQTTSGLTKFKLKEGTDKTTSYYDVDRHGRVFHDMNAALSGNICPEGWHVPSLSEWEELERYMMSQEKYVCGISSTHIAKALADSVEWKYYLNPRPEDSINIGYNPLTTNNASGFSAQAWGYDPIEGSKARYEGEATRFWTSTPGESFGEVMKSAYFIELNIDNPYIFKDDKHIGGFYSIRCIKDKEINN